MTSRVLDLVFFYPSIITPLFDVKRNAVPTGNTVARSRTVREILRVAALIWLVRMTGATMVGSDNRLAPVLALVCGSFVDFGMHKVLPSLYSTGVVNGDRCICLYCIRLCAEKTDIVWIGYNKTYNEGTQLPVILAVKMKVAEFFRSCGDSAEFSDSLVQVIRLIRYQPSQAQLIQNSY